MYEISAKDEEMTRLVWDAERKVFVFGNSNGEVVTADVSTKRTVATEDGISCLAVAPNGKKCAIAVDTEVTERFFPSSNDVIRDSRISLTQRKELCVSHMEYNRYGDHL
jgi:hypothetical protein